MLFKQVLWYKLIMSHYCKANMTSPGTHLISTRGALSETTEKITKASLCRWHLRYFNKHSHYAFSTCTITSYCASLTLYKKKTENPLRTFWKTLLLKEDFNFKHSPVHSFYSPTISLMKENWTFLPVIYRRSSLIVTARCFVKLI